VRVFVDQEDIICQLLDDGAHVDGITRTLACLVVNL
jgi:hypothetical protein